MRRSKTTGIGAQDGDAQSVADLPPSADAARRFALVMSGGGARGAYEAGVLGFILDELPDQLGRPIRFQVITGTSVGAIHACYVAAMQGRAHAGQGLTKIWRSLEASGVYHLGLGDAVNIPFRLLGFSRAGTKPSHDGIPERLKGLLDTSPLERLVRESIPWGDLRRNIDMREVDAVAIAATEISSGKSIVWVDNRERAVCRWAHDPFVVARPTALGPAHALASASIPFIFPAPKIDGRYFCDGGLRLNTPLAPALRLGADRLLIIGLRHPPTPEEEAALTPHRESNYSSPAYLAGKVLNALLLDHVDYDVDRLRIVNAILDTGSRAYGPDFMRRINAVIEEMRGIPYRVVRNVYILPSRDLGVIAAECFRHRRRRGGPRRWVSNMIARYAVPGLAAEADLLSYLYFDDCYVRHLIALGRSDAAAHAEELLAFFRDETLDATEIRGSEPKPRSPASRSGVTRRTNSRTEK